MPALTNTLRNRVQFIREFVRNPTGTGAVAPSSRFLTRRMVTGIGLERARAVAEFGPGTGACTGAIIERLPRGAVYFAVEQNPKMAATLRERYPKIKIHVDSAANIRAICDAEGVEQLDCVLSGIPWASLPDKVQDEILGPTVEVLRPGGCFVTFAYQIGMLKPEAKRFRSKLHEHFAKVEKTAPVWRNVPPAFVYRCTKAG